MRHTSTVGNVFNRRQLLAAAAAMAATPAWAGGRPGRSRLSPVERRDLYPEGVASGDPDAHSVILWTRRPNMDGTAARVRIEVAEDEAFQRVIATTRATLRPEADWTCRVLVGNLQPSRVYWYRFIDDQGFASRVGRTLTAPADDDPRPVNFTFVSCQDINLSFLNAYRRMIFDDERATEDRRLEFVLHLGDFIYSPVWYPEDKAPAFGERRIFDVVRYPQGEPEDWGQAGAGHVAVTLEDFRTVFRAHLRDPDIQDARARWPFIAIWDNDEFSDFSWQSMRIVGGKSLPSQVRKVASNQAWFEYQPARIAKASGPSLETFDAPKVTDVAFTRIGADGLGDEPNNRLAVASLKGYRALRWGRNVELLLTDLFSYRTQPPSTHPELAAMASSALPGVYPQDALEILDAGRDYDGGHPPAEIRFGDRSIPNFRKDAPPQSRLGTEQAAWFLDRLTRSKATWKIWGHTQGCLPDRLDLANLPPGIENPWPGAAYACSEEAVGELARIYETVQAAGVTGFATVSGNRHSFWAGFSAASLPPRPYRPVGLNFITGALSSVSPLEYYASMAPADRPFGQLSVTERPDAKPAPTGNILYRHGFKAAAEYAATGDLAQAHALSNPDLAPHLKFLDLDGQGYAIVRAAPDALECEFVCIERPAVKAKTPDGGPLVYRVVHRAPLWTSGETPRLNQQVLEGAPGTSL